MTDLAGTAFSPPVLSGYNGSAHSFLPRNNAADELARRGALLGPSAIPSSLSPLISRIHSRLISDWRHTVSLKFFDTQVSSISTEELVVSRLRCNGQSQMLSSYLSRIGRIENPSCSACGHLSKDTSHFILHRPATNFLSRSLFGDSQSLYDLWSRPWGVARLLGAPWSSAMPPSLGRGRVINNNINFKTESIASLCFQMYLHAFFTLNQCT